ncbi:MULTISPECIES: AAA family ATPase [unclassified Ruegeria]|uniref:AAA family ATPase n=1 Tax=unclassified Ruegeria TaxID=2625375 RepID=UPI001ADB2D21|nr:MULTISPECIES: AAA family ATPase [unclassified Ruegeria]MBO9411764.1 hypothetical protein [Ruegeria sp. R8_1]MBO9415675.1 hypothetical protein [Ruegeria sp. R8_2]
MISRLKLDRMVVTRGASIIFDESFHEGVNIIHGSNGSGKSTLADFIFFGLGGELKDWKPYASRADLVFLQITTASGVLTLRREVSSKGSRPMDIFFGKMSNALETPSDAWQSLPYKRPEHGFSFSQVLFRAIGLPEAVSDGSSNITMHQVLRLLYVDQLTPIQRIFRSENFDTWQTRQAVGDLLAGVGGYDLFEKQLALREASKQYDALTAQYRSLVAVASGYGENILMEHIESAQEKAKSERNDLLKTIDSLLAADPSDDEVSTIQRNRREAIKNYKKTRKNVFELNEEIDVLEYEIDDSEEFIQHLRLSLDDFEAASDTFFALGHLDFEFCPSCFAPVKRKAEEHCQLCDTPRSQDEDDSRTLAVKLDLQMQLKESLSLQQERRIDLDKLKANLRIEKQSLRKLTATVEFFQSGHSSGRESEIAEVSRKIGFIDSELEALQKRFEIAKKVKDAADAKEDMNNRLTRLKDEIARIEQAQKKRKSIAYTAISDSAKGLLEKDLKEHSDFGEIKYVNFDFSGDWVAINNEKNRAGSASGMVVLKNSFSAAMFKASLSDSGFNLPRWMLFDNIEDKGMVQERSWNFQRLLVSTSQNSKTPHQIIFTTSKIAPDLDRPDLVVGKKYTRADRSLK